MAERQLSFGQSWGLMSIMGAQSRANSVSRSAKRIPSSDIAVNC